MGEIGSAIAESIKNRATSVTLVTYTIFWAIWHWEGIYATLFTSQDLIYSRYGLLKNEYIQTYFFGWHWYGWNHWQNWAGIISHILGFIIPAALTYIFIGPFSKFALVPMYGLEQDSRTRRRYIKLVEDKKIQDAKAELAKEETRRARAETEKIAARTELQQEKQKAEKIDPKIVWEEEFLKFKEHPDYHLFAQVLRCVYEYYGNAKVSDYSSIDGSYEFELSPRSMMAADTRGLISIAANGDKIQLTEKGKFFASLYDKAF